MSTAGAPFASPPRGNSLLPREKSQISRRTASSVKLLQAEPLPLNVNGQSYETTEQKYDPKSMQDKSDKLHAPKPPLVNRFSSALALFMPADRRLERGSGSTRSSITLKRENKKLRILLTTTALVCLGLTAFVATMAIRHPDSRFNLLPALTRRDTATSLPSTEPKETVQPQAVPPQATPVVVPFAQNLPGSKTGMDGPGIAIVDGGLSAATIASISTTSDEVAEMLKMDAARSKTRKVDPMSLNGTEEVKISKRAPAGSVAWFDVGADYPQEGAVYWGNDWGMDPNAWDNGPQLMNCIQACRNAGNCKILVRQGTYWFRESIVVFQDLHDFVLDGQNSIFMFIRNIPAATYAPLFTVQNCLRCRFQGFTVDWVRS
jgi:hypothetical protein